MGAAMKTIGVIGAGQLGLMLAEEAHKLGARVVTLDPAADAPAARVADGHIVAAYDDGAALEELCRRSDVVTYEFENVPGEVLIPLVERYNIPQGFQPLYDSQDRLREKRNAVAHGLRTPRFAPADDRPSLEAAARALATFSGVRRRFDLIGEAGGVVVVDDYAHHPTEIQATIRAASKLDFEHVHVLFQPHRYSRTESLAREFGPAFDDADSVIVMDVYPAGETPIPGVNGKTVIDSILRHNPRQQVAWLPHRPEIIPFLQQKLEAGDLVITMGAGDVTTMAPLLTRALSGE